MVKALKIQSNLLLLLSFFLSIASFSQTFNVKKLDSLFSILQNRGMASGSVAISVNGKIVYQRAIGFALIDSNGKIEADKETKYRVGSVSKMFTAAMVLQLVKEGKLSLGDKLVKWFPQVPNASKISIENMLYHRSGLHDYTKDTGFPEWMDKQKSQEELLQLITEKGSDFEPGSRADYSNSNFLLLSYIIEKIDDKPYPAALRERILSKAGLKNTYYGGDISINRNEAASYKFADSAWKKEKQTNPAIHSGAGSIVSTPADLVSFIQHLFKQQEVEKMKTMIDGYGMGMFPYDFAGAKGYGHYGRVEEFYSAVTYYPEKKLAMSYVTNGILFPRTDIIDGLMKICFNQPYIIPFSKPVVLQSSDLDKYAGEYSSPDLPFKVVCKNENNTLIIEALGKTITAEAVKPDYFMNLKMGAFFEFDTKKGELKVKETDNVYTLKKSR